MVFEEIEVRTPVIFIITAWKANRALRHSADPQEWDGANYRRLNELEASQLQIFFNFILLAYIRQLLSHFSSHREFHQLHILLTLTVRVEGAQQWAWGSGLTEHWSPLLLPLLTPPAEGTALTLSPQVEQGPRPPLPRSGASSKSCN